MIKNPRQLAFAESQLKRIEEKLKDIISKKGDLSEIEYKLHHSAIASKYEDIYKEIEEYKSLKNGRLKAISISSFDEIPQALIKTRMAKGISQKKLAEKLGIQQQQVQRYESTDYESAKFSRIQDVCEALEIQFSFECIILADNEPFDLGVDLDSLRGYRKTVFERKTLFAVCA